jgi:hypothetical protein
VALKVAVLNLLSVMAEKGAMIIWAPVASLETIERALTSSLRTEEVSRRYCFQPHIAKAPRPGSHKAINEMLTGISCLSTAHAHCLHAAFDSQLLHNTGITGKKPYLSWIQAEPKADKERGFTPSDTFVCPMVQKYTGRVGAVDVQAANAVNIALPFNFISQYIAEGQQQQELLLAVGDGGSGALAAALLGVNSVSVDHEEQQKIVTEKRIYKLLEQQAGETNTLKVIMDGMQHPVGRMIPNLLELDASEEEEGEGDEEYKDEEDGEANQGGGSEGEEKQGGGNEEGGDEEEEIEEAAEEEEPTATQEEETPEQRPVTETMD